MNQLFGLQHRGDRYLGIAQICPHDYHAADAKIDLKRGVVITTSKAVAPETFPLFGPASFHENDYPLYYYNIKANAATRVAAYKKNAK